MATNKLLYANNASTTLGSAVGVSDTSITVSYTHLTLPTIYSV